MSKQCDWHGFLSHPDRTKCAIKFLSSEAKFALFGEDNSNEGIPVPSTSRKENLFQTDSAKNSSKLARPISSWKLSLPGGHTASLSYVRPSLLMSQENSEFSNRVPGGMVKLDIEISTILEETSFDEEFHPEYYSSSENRSEVDTLTNELDGKKHQDVKKLVSGLLNGHSKSFHNCFTAKIWMDAWESDFKMVDDQKDGGLQSLTVDNWKVLLDFAVGVGLPDFFLGTVVPDMIESDGVKAVDSEDHNNLLSAVKLAARHSSLIKLSFADFTGQLKSMNFSQVDKKDKSKGSFDGEGHCVCMA